MAGQKLMIGAIERINDWVPIGVWDDLLLWLKRRRLSRDEQIEILEMLTAMKEAGATDKPAVSALNEEYEEEYGKECLQCEFFRMALKSIGSGSSLDAAMNEWFAPDLSMIVRTAAAARVGDKAHQDESYKNMERPLTTLLRLSTERQKVMNDLLKEFKKPFFSILMGLAATYGAARYGVRMMAGDTPRSEWSLLARMYDAFGTWMGQWMDVLFVLFALFVVAYFYCLKFYDGEYRLLMDKWVPGFSFYQAVVAGQFFAVMSVLVSPIGGRMKLKEALSEFSSNDNLNNPYISLHIDEMLYRCGDGSFELDQLDTGLLPSRMKIRLSVAGRSKQGLSVAKTFEDIANNLSHDFAMVTVRRMRGSMKTINAISLLLLAGAMFAIMDGGFAKLDTVL
ncbi:hypothetical protein AB9X29_003766 [Vibrio vulnificus]